MFLLNSIANFIFISVPLIISGPAHLHTTVKMTIWVSFLLVFFTQLSPFKSHFNTCFAVMFHQAFFLNLYFFSLLSNLTALIAPKHAFLFHLIDVFPSSSRVSKCCFDNLIFSFPSFSLVRGNSPNVFAPFHFLAKS